MKSKRFNDVLYIKLPKEMKEKIIAQAEKKFKNVSEYIRELIVEDLNKEE